MLEARELLAAVLQPFVAAGAGAGSDVADVRHERDLLRVYALDQALEQIRLQLRIGNVAEQGEGERDEELRFRRPCAAG